MPKKKKKDATDIRRELQKGYAKRKRKRKREFARRLKRCGGWGDGSHIGPRLGRRKFASRWMAFPPMPGED